PESSVLYGVAPGIDWVVLNGLLLAVPPSACCQALSARRFCGVTGAPPPVRICCCQFGTPGIAIYATLCLAIGCPWACAIVCALSRSRSCSEIWPGLKAGLGSKEPPPKAPPGIGSSEPPGKPPPGLVSGTLIFDPPGSRVSGMLISGPEPETLLGISGRLLVSPLHGSMP